MCVIMKTCWTSEIRVPPVWSQLVVSNTFYFHPKSWGNDPIWRAYFSNGLKPPTRTCFFYFMHLVEFEFLIQLRVSTLGSVRWGVVLGCDGGDRLEQSLGCGTDGKSLRLSDGQIGYWSTGGQNADNMVVEIIFPRKNGNPPLFWILCFFCRKTAWWHAMKPQRHPFQCRFSWFLLGCWDQLENFESLLSLKFWMSLGDENIIDDPKAILTQETQALGPPKSSFFVSTGWCLCH